MGVGPFNFNRPFTAGDDGILGLNRPLVGAASGVTFKVTTESDKRVVFDKTVPLVLQKERQRLEDINTEIRNKQEKLNLIRDFITDRMMDRFPKPSPVNSPYRNREDQLADEIFMLEMDRDRVENVIADIIENNMISESGAAQELETVLDENLQGLAISEGPTVTPLGDRLEVSASIVNITEGDSIKMREQMEDLGLDVTSREFFER